MARPTSNSGGFDYNRARYALQARDKGGEHARTIQTLLAQGDACVEPVKRYEKHARRTVVRRVAEYSPSTDEERATLFALGSALFEWKEPSDRAAGAKMLASSHADVAPFAKTIIGRLSRERDPAAASALGPLLPRLGLAQEDLIKLCKKHTEHWSSSIRAHARRVLADAGQEVAPTPLDSSPLSDIVMRDVLRLGGKPAPFNPSKPRPLGEWHRERDGVDSEWVNVDPDGQIKKLPSFVAAFDKLHWERPLTLDAHDDKDMLERLDMGWAAENRDCIHQLYRALLWPFATTGHHIHYCFNLLDSQWGWDDPPVWAMDHGGGTVYGRMHISFSEFAKKLK